MTFHAPQSNARLISIVARRVFFSRASILAATAIVSTTVVLAGRASDTNPASSVRALSLHKDIALTRPGIHHPGIGDSKRAELALLRDAPDRLSLPSSRDHLLTPDLSESLNALTTTGPAKLDLDPLKDGGPLGSKITEAGMQPDAPKAKAVEIASLEPPSHDWGTLDSVLAPRFPELGPVPLIPPTGDLPKADTVPEIDGLESGPSIVTLTAKTDESLEDMLSRTDLRDEDHRATLVALRADDITDALIEGDMIDLAFLAEDDNQLLAIRLRQLGKPPVELRWDGQTQALWDPIEVDPSLATATPTLKEAPETLSITGKRDDTIFVSGEIKSSLYAAGAEAGLTAGEIKSLTNIFRYSVDFERDLRKGDRFEAMFIKGKNGSYGDILYAKLNNRGSEIALYRGEDDATGEVGYFDATGKTNKRSLMRTPVAGARVSSHFGMRLHPVLGYNKMHRGTDFRAPRGTPIFAAGDGIVEYVGRKGAYGKYIRIRHNGVYETAYAHLSRYTNGLQSGARVRQGDVIGYVGSTGRSTGPHLHFEILQHGNQINPLKVADFGPTRGLSGPALSAFKVRVSRIEIALTLMRNGSRVATAN